MENYMNEFLESLIIGIIGGIFSSVIVSRIFLIRQNYQDQLDVLRQTFYSLGGVSAFLDVIEIILKNIHDTHVELNSNPLYAKEGNFLDADKTMESLKKGILLESISKIKANNQTIVLKEKRLRELQIESNNTVCKLEKVPVENYKFETIDSLKKEIKTLVSKFDKIFSAKSKDFFILVLKDKTLIILALIFIALCVLSIIL